MDRLRTIAKNVFYNVGGWSVSVLIKLLVIPYYIGQLSPEGYGLYAVLHSLTGYISIMDLGLAKGVTKFVAEYEERGQNRLIARYVANAYLIVGVIAVAVGMAIYGLRGTLADLLTQKRIDAEILETGFLVVACTVFFALATMVGSATLKGFQRYDLVNRVTIAAGIGGALGGVGLLSVGYGVITLILVDFGVAALSATVLGGIALYRMDRIRPEHW
jgi:O-antigen/teichoic acid export membrane protein